MTGLIVAWVVLIVIVILIYRNPGFRNSTQMVKTFPSREPSGAQAEDVAEEGPRLR